MSEWISVAERLPPDASVVLIVVNRNVETGVFWDDWFGVGGTRCEPTHWAQLPPPPALPELPK